MTALILNVRHVFEYPSIFENLSIIHFITDFAMQRIGRCLRVIKNYQC